MIRCEHCGSVLPDGAIFCGECGRAVTAAASRRTAAPEPVDRATPPPLQQPDQHGRRQDPAAEAWLPESTLDPATRAWLTGEDRRRSGPVAPIPVQTPDAFAPRSAPTHVHGAGSGLGEWTGASEPPLDPDAFPAEPLRPEDDPEVTRIAQRSAGPDATGADAPAVPAPPTARDEPAAPIWAPPQQSPAPSTPSWWIGRATDDTAAAHETDHDPAPVAQPTASESRRDGAQQGVPDGEQPPTPSTGDPATEHPAGDRPAADRSDVDEPARPGDTAVVTPLVERRAPRPTPLVQPGTHPTTCHVCGHQLEPDDIFCNECGAVRPAVTAAFTGPVVPLPIARPDWAAQATPDDAVPDAVGPDDAAPDAVEPDDALPEPDDALPEPDDALAEPDDALPEPDDALLEPDDVAPRAGDVSSGADDHAAPVDGAASDGHADAHAPTAAPLPPVPGVTGPVLPPTSAHVLPSSSDADESTQQDDEEDDEDVDATRIVTKTPTQAPFMLHFSTGERLGVHGTGLLGRLPRPQPGERFDDLLTIRDPGKSVSKTHLEIGRDGDDLWVSDRFSGNGTVIRHIDGSVRRCEPGRRYRVERGARVDIGEQFFLVQ